MAKRKRFSTKSSLTSRSAPVARGPGRTLSSSTVGALPILNRIIQRMKLEEFLRGYLPREDGRTRLSTARGILVLVKNILISRQPIYGVGEWAARYAPDLLGLAAAEVGLLNDDRMGRCLEKLFDCEHGSLVLALVVHVVDEFQVALDALHNDGTTVSFFGAYQRAARERIQRGRKTLAITFGHSKDHRPDLKQLLYVLTVAQDGAVPVYFTAASGNVTDDTTHRRTWDVLCELVGRRDFLYVADSKLATRANLGHIHRNGGRFISVLPRTRKEDADFRKRMLREQVTWQSLLEKTNEEGNVVDRISVCGEPSVTAEGYRLLWYHGTRKAELDAAARADAIERALGQLAELREKLRSPRTRYQQKAKVHKAVDEIFQSCGVRRWILVRIEEVEQESYRQEKPGRPAKQTRYVKRVKRRFDLAYEIDTVKLAEDRATDGIFPLVTNVDAMSELEVLQHYKKQPLLEKRFSQLKTDFEVAPVYLKEVRRIQALLCVYFFVLLAEALLERELRQAMEREGIEALPMYPEGRPCRCPTARRLIDLFEPVQRHTLAIGKKAPVIMVTELSRLQRRLLKLLGLPAKDYAR
ncbi:MAG: IS1634 family transposase [Phycisphaerales bacterium]|nr:MAG: IS1634 family transposase [Phycisphaerales bacterium]